jgi:PAS domain S-box-containing protein
MDTVFTQGSPEDRFALLDALYARAPVGLAFFDTELRYRRVNAALAAGNGRPIEDHIGRTVSEVMGAPGEQLAAVLGHVLDTGEPVDGRELTVETPGTPGEQRSWRISLYPVADAEGRARGVGAVVVESTPERRAAAEAEAARALLDVVFDTAPVGMAFWDRELRYVRINQAATEINGLTADEHLGRRVDAVLGGPLGERIATLLQDVLDSGEPVLGLELSGDRPGRPGEPHYREVSYFPLPGPDGTTVGVGAVAQDVTARRRLDELRERLLEREHEGRLAAEAARRRAEFVVAAGDALNASLDWEETVRAAVGVAVPTAADLCVLHLATPDDGLEVAAVAHADPRLEALARELAERFGPKLSEAHGVAEAIRTGRTLTAFDIPEARIDAVATSEEHRDGLRALAPRSLLAVPVTAGARAGERAPAHRALAHRPDAAALAAAARAAVAAGPGGGRRLLPRR